MKKNYWIILGVLALAITACTSADKKKTKGEESFTFAFLTDIHVEYGKRANIGFQQAIDSVNSQNPDFIVTGGDLIADALGQTEELATKRYDLYLELEQGFNAPVYNTQGNHEEFGIYENSGVDTDHPLYGDKMYEAKISKRFYSFTEHGWKFFILDSVEETEDRRYIGHVDSIQIKWLAEELKTVDTETPAIIVTHIPLLTAYAQINGGAMARNSVGLVVDNSKEVLDLFANHNLKAVLQGHLHFLEDVYVNDIHFITGGAVCARWWDGPINGIEEGYLLIHVKGEELDWEYIDYGWEVEKS